MDRTCPRLIKAGVTSAASASIAKGARYFHVAGLAACDGKWPARWQYHLIVGSKVVGALRRGTVFHASAAKSTQ
jgi:hypothetical protein